MQNTAKTTFVHNSALKLFAHLHATFWAIFDLVLWLFYRKTTDYSEECQNGQKSCFGQTRNFPASKKNDFYYVGDKLDDTKSALVSRIVHTHFPIFFFIECGPVPSTAHIVISVIFVCTKVHERWFSIKKTAPSVKTRYTKKLESRTGFIFAKIGDHLKRVKTIELRFSSYFRICIASQCFFRKKQ